MANAMNTAPALRIVPGLKEALRTAADRKHHSIANTVEVLIRDYCGRNGITIQEQRQPPAEGKRKPHTGKR